MRKSIPVVFCLVFQLLIFFVSAMAFDAVFNYQGRALDSENNPLDGIYSVTFTIYDLEVGGTALWSETTDITFTDGLFSHKLGSISPPINGAFEGDSTLPWLEVSIGGETTTPRTQFTWVPLSMASIRADTAYRVDDNSISLNNLEGSAASAGQIIKKGISGWEYAWPPGISSGFFDQVYLSVNYPYMSDIITTSIYIPDSGYVVVTGTCNARLSPNGSDVNSFIFQIDTLSGGPDDYDHLQSVGSPGIQGSYSCCVNRIFYINTAGSYNFRFVGRHYTTGSTEGTLELTACNIMAQYFPKAYGEVQQ